MLDLVREGESLVDASQRAVRTQRLRLKLRQQSAVEPQIDPDALLDESRQNPSNLGCAGHGIIHPTPSPTSMQFGFVEVLRRPMLSRDDLQSLGRAQRRQGVATPEFQIRFPEEGICDRADVTGVSRAASRKVDQFTRAFELTQLPHGRSEA